MLLNEQELEKLRQSIRQMTRETKLYKLLKEELSSLDYWKPKNRGSSIESLRSSHYYGKAG